MDGFGLWQSEGDTCGEYVMRSVLFAGFVWLGLLPTNALAERYIAECVIVETAGAIVTDGSPQYYSGFQNTYQKGDTLFLGLAIARGDGRLIQTELNLIDQKRDRTMVSATFVSDKPGVVTGNNWSDTYEIFEHGFKVSGPSGALLAADTVLRFYTADTFLELRPFSSEMMHGTMLQNQDFIVTQNRVSSQFSVLKCVNKLSSVQEVIDYLQTYSKK